MDKNSEKKIFAAFVPLLRCPSAPKGRYMKAQRNALGRLQKHPKP
jgi:hypothetical protein